ncbi:hypothetical protein AZE42_01834 [Rhizopogon vesiculosus]|uniref:Uncharacterized protein n=1 Tax=Rhizopogon vesiculosus TaxID=180088 RepID=A0A1J8PQZ5_9AGAM|nr:hypothetical protein AZE42_01834 [Rhizopogon vesiculosus]
MADRVLMLNPVI